MLSLIESTEEKQKKIQLLEIMEEKSTVSCKTRIVKRGTIKTHQINGFSGE